MHEHLPPALKDEQALTDLGVAVCKEIEASEMGKGSLPDRWEKNEQLYNIDPRATNLNIVEGLASYPIPLWKPKADRIIGTVFKAITGIEPYVQLVPESEEAELVEAASRVEKALMTLATHDPGKYGFDRALRQALRIAVNTGVSAIYVHPLDDGSILFEPTHPKDLVVYPHEVGDMQKAKTIGHRYWKLRSEITALKEAGKYITDDVGGANAVGERGGKSEDFGKTTDTPSAIPADDQIECFQVVRRCDLGEGETDYIICVAYQNKKVLMVEPLPYEKGRLYYDVRFDDEYGSFWPAMSPGQDVQGLQLLYSDLHNVIIHGSYAAAFPDTYIIGGTLNTKIKRRSVGTVYELPANVSVQQFNNGFNGEGLANMIPQIERVADSVSRISQLGTSQNMPSGTTATAAAGFLQAQEEGKDQYTTYIAPVVAEIFQFLLELLQSHFELFTEKHGSTLGIQSFEELTIPYRFLPTGKSSTSSPQVLIQKLQMVMQLAMSPGTKLDPGAVENQILQALDLPFSTMGLLRKTIGEEGWMMILEGVLTGQMDPEQAAQMLLEAKAAITGQTPTGGLPAGGQPPSGASDSSSQGPPSQGAGAVSGGPAY